MLQEKQLEEQVEKKVSIKKNFLLNLINTLSTLLYPLITFPYASRILLADGIGQVQFFQSIIDYIALFAALGIPLYAVRKVAGIGNNPYERNRVTIEILILHTLLTLVSYLVVFILIATVSKIQVDIPLFLLLSVSLLFNAIGVTWFYQAVEDFKYITIRTIAVKLFSLIALFIFVKTKGDLLWYAGITVVANVGSNLFNFYRLRKYLRWKDYSFRDLVPLTHLKPALHIFVLNLIISIYVNLDSIMLGFLTDESAVGYYTAATRLTKAILGIIMALGGVLLPRFSNLLGAGCKEEFNLLAGKVINFTVALSFPLFVGLVVFAQPIIHLFCGNSFYPSVYTLQIVSPIIVFIGLSNIIGIQILYPQGKEKIVIIATASGAVVNFLLNLFLIPVLYQDGAALATSVAEFVVLASMIVIGRKYLPFRLLTKQHFNYVLASLLMGLAGLLIFMLKLNDLFLLLIGIPFCIFVYFAYLYIGKDPFILELKQIIKSKLNRNRKI